MLFSSPSDGLHLTPKGNALVHEEVVKTLRGAGLRAQDMPHDFPHHSKIDGVCPEKAFQWRDFKLCDEVWAPCFLYLEVFSFLLLFLELLHWKLLRCGSEWRGRLLQPTYPCCNLVVYFVWMIKTVLESRCSPAFFLLKNRTEPALDFCHQTCGMNMIITMEYYVLQKRLWS